MREGIFQPEMPERLTGCPRKQLTQRLPRQDVKVVGIPTAMLLMPWQAKKARPWCKGIRWTAKGPKRWKWGCRWATRRAGRHVGGRAGRDDCQFVMRTANLQEIVNDYDHDLSNSDQIYCNRSWSLCSCISSIHKNILFDKHDYTVSIFKHDCKQIIHCIHHSQWLVDNHASMTMISRYHRDNHHCIYRYIQLDRSIIAIHTQVSEYYRRLWKLFIS